MLQCYAFNKAGSRTTCNHVYFLCWRQSIVRKLLYVCCEYLDAEKCFIQQVCVDVTSPVYSGYIRRVHIHLLCNVILLFVSIPHSGADKPLQAMV